MSQPDSILPLSSTQLSRRLPVGAEVQPGGSTHFRVWAPRASQVALVISGADGDSEYAMAGEPDGYHAVLAPVGDGTRYRYRLDGRLLADPASRFQPDGVFGPSQVVDPGLYHWSDSAWRGVTLPGQVVYELHVGTFTAGGTWRTAIERLPHLARVGVTLVEVMPLSEFPGRFGWGYDGVFPYAPTRLYGDPDDFRTFVDRAHALGLGVMLDVVYNHLGPDGCVFGSYARAYYSQRYGNEWGEALNFDGDDAAPVREYFIGNAGYWIDEFHLDGLRLDATQAIHDASGRHVVAEVAARARQAAGTRDVLIVAENESQDVRMVTPESAGGHGLDGIWNDDFHHSAVVALTGKHEAYYSDHRGAPQELVSAAKRGFLFQGQRYAWQRQPRGSRTDHVPAPAFVTFIENHDQVANSGDGSRLYLRTSPGRYRAMCALFLLIPGTPMLFQGQEFGSTAPFLFFADHNPELAAAVRKGRAAFVAQFPSLASPESQALLAAPEAPATFEACKLRWEECTPDNRHLKLITDLLAMRRHDAAFRCQRREALDGAVLAPEAFVLRFTDTGAADERLLIVNLGADLVASAFAEPLVAPPAGHRWQLRWSSEHPAYGGAGTADPVTKDGWRVPGHAAFVLSPVEGTDEADHSA